MPGADRKDRELKKHEYDEGAMPSPKPLPEEQPQQHAEFTSPERLEDVEEDLEQRKK